MRKEFNKRVGYIEPELLSLASIVQGEANNVDDMKIVAGILLERLAIDMPLQVDVATTTYEIYGAPELLSIILDWTRLMLYVTRQNFLLVLSNWR